MNAYSSDFHHPGKESVTLAAAIHDHPSSAVFDESIIIRWAALHDAAAAVATLGKLPPDLASNRLPDIAALFAGAPGWKTNLLRNGLDDIAAFMQSGLAALLAVTAAGRDPVAAANTLLNEFGYSREAVLALVCDQGA